MRAYPIMNLSADGAALAIDAAEKVAKERGLRISTAVVDAAGRLVAFRRMDGAKIVTIGSAQGKALSAAIVGEPTGVFQEIVKQGAVTLLAVEGLFPVQGGVPIVVEGETIGAIGCAGSTGQLDELMAAAGAAAAAAEDPAP